MKGTDGGRVLLSLARLVTPILSSLGKFPSLR